jgi:replicative superfamily II helicase
MDELSPCLEVLITRLQDRITAGAQEEILCLTSIPMIGVARARMLYNAGQGGLCSSFNFNRPLAPI